MCFKALKGKLIGLLIEEAESVSKGGLTVINRKEVAHKAKVLSVGEDQVVGKRVFKAPCKEGDIIYFKANTPVSLEAYGQDGLRRGKFMIYFDEVIAVE